MINSKPIIAKRLVDKWKVYTVKHFYNTRDPEDMLNRGDILISLACERWHRVDRRGVREPKDGVWNECE